MAHKSTLETDTGLSEMCHLSFRRLRCLRAFARSAPPPLESVCLIEKRGFDYRFMLPVNIQVAVSHPSSVRTVCEDDCDSLAGPLFSLAGLYLFRVQYVDYLAGASRSKIFLKNPPDDCSLSLINLKRPFAVFGPAVPKRRWTRAVTSALDGIKLSASDFCSMGHRRSGRSGVCFPTIRSSLYGHRVHPCSQTRLHYEPRLPSPGEKWLNCPRATSKLQVRPPSEQSRPTIANSAFPSMLVNILSRSARFVKHILAVCQIIADHVLDLATSWASTFPSHSACRFATSQDSRCSPAGMLTRRGK